MLDKIEEKYEWFDSLLEKNEANNETIEENNGIEGVGETGMWEGEEESGSKLLVQNIKTSTSDKRNRDWLLAVIAVPSLADPGSERKSTQEVIQWLVSEVSPDHWFTSLLFPPILILSQQTNKQNIRFCCDYVSHSVKSVDCR